MIKIYYETFCFNFRLLNTNDLHFNAPWAANMFCNKDTQFESQNLHCFLETHTPGNSALCEVHNTT